MKPEELRIIFKLNGYESKVLSALVLNSVLTVSEIYKLTKVPRSRIYDTCSVLQNKGFIIFLEKEPKILKKYKVEKEFKPKRYKAKTLDEMRESIFKLIDLKAQEEKDHINNMIEIIDKK